MTDEKTPAQKAGWQVGDRGIRLKDDDGLGVTAGTEVELYIDDGSAAPMFRVHGKCAFRLAGDDPGCYMNLGKVERFGQTEKSLTEVVEELQSLPGNGWNELSDPLGELQAMRGGWQPISTAPAQRIVLVHYLNSHDRSRIIRARYVPMLTEAMNPDSEIDGDYCDIGDVFCVPAGWYEQIDNWGDLSEVEVTEGQPDAWMPLPAPPEQKQEQPQ